MFTDEQIVTEMLDFLEFRKAIMDEPYIIVGQHFAEKLKEHHENIGLQYRVEEAWGNNVRFICLDKGDMQND